MAFSHPRRRKSTAHNRTQFFPSATATTSSVSPAKKECVAPRAHAFPFKFEGSRSPSGASIARTSSTSTACPDSPTSEHHRTQDESASSDAGDEVSAVFVDATSDSELGDEFNTSIRTSVFSMLMLLRLRSVVLQTDRRPPAVRYSSCHIRESEAPTVVCQPESSKSMQGAGAGWRPSLRPFVRPVPQVPVANAHQTIRDVSVSSAAPQEFADDGFESAEDTPCVHQAKPILCQTVVPTVEIAPVVQEPDAGKLPESTAALVRAAPWRVPKPPAPAPEPIEIAADVCTSPRIPSPPTAKLLDTATDVRSVAQKLSKLLKDADIEEEKEVPKPPKPNVPPAAVGSWVTQHRRSLSENDDAKVVRAARSILNKLTIEKFEPLFEQLTSCGIRQPHHVSMLMQEIFEKATIQHHFIPMYADLCVRLERDKRIAAVAKEAPELYSFRRLLLNQCQNVFEQVLDPGSAKIDKANVDEEEAIHRKQRALGNMKLIGHLLVNGMLSSELFAQCSEELLNRRSECPEALEALVALMWVAGPKFDNANCQFHSRVENILAEMKVLTKDKPTPTRLRFLIRDVLDSREAGWPSTVVGPAKLKQVSNAEVKNQASAAKQNVKPTVDANKGNDDFQASNSMPSSAESTSNHVFEMVTFRRTLASVFSDLALEKNVPAATQRIRAEQVPSDVQANMFMDIITRVVEERRGVVRRCQFAFIASLVAGDLSAFERTEGLAGLKLFFEDVYDDLCQEVPRLPAILKAEFIPTMLNVFSADELNSVLPETLLKLGSRDAPTGHSSKLAA